MEKVTGIGCIFFDADDPERLACWYEKHLGINLNRMTDGDAPWIQEKGPTRLIFNDRNHPLRKDREGKFQMTTFRVRDLDAMIAQLRAAGITVKIYKSDTGPDGRSVTVFDPENNAVELWEPRGSQNITIRAATLADIPLLADMMSEFYTESRMPLDRARAGASFAGLLSDPTRGAVWIVYDESQAAGYVVLTVRFSMEYGGLDGFVDDLFIRPSHRRRGLGDAALKELFAECRRRGVLAVHVEVGQDNAAAKALYASHGLALRIDDRALLTAVLDTRSDASVPASTRPEEKEKAGRGKRGRKPISV